MSAEEIGFWLGQAFAIGMVLAFCAGWVALVFWVTRYIITNWNRRHEVQVTKAAEVNREFAVGASRAESLAFWLDRQESGTPVEKALAPQMLDVLGYVNPEPGAVPKQTTWAWEGDRRAHLLRTMRETTNPDVREDCQWELQQLAKETPERTALDVIRKSSEAAWRSMNQVGQAAGPTIERLAALYPAAKAPETWRGGYTGTRAELETDVREVLKGLRRDIVHPSVTKPGVKIMLNRGGCLVVESVNHRPGLGRCIIVKHEASGIRMLGELG